MPAEGREDAGAEADVEEDSEPGAEAMNGHVERMDHSGPAGEDSSS